MENKKDKEQKGPKKAVKPKDKDQQIKDLIETIQRLQAEFENYKKRVEKERIEFIKYAKEGLIRKLLPILDSFECALKNKDKNEDFIKGIELIFSQLYTTLEQEGLKPINTNGQKFDPYNHEALLQEKSENEDGTILEELQKGYILNEKVIRHSKVKVSKNEA